MNSICHIYIFKVLNWFQEKSDIISKVLYKKQPFDTFKMNLILALGVTYYVRLDNRKQYASELVVHFEELKKQPKLFKDIIERCQDKFIDELRLEGNIAKNDALKVFLQDFFR